MQATARQKQEVDDGGMNFDSKFGISQRTGPISAILKLTPSRSTHISLR